MKWKFFNYKAGAAKLIENTLSKLSWLQIIKQDIKEAETPIGLNVAFSVIYLVNNKEYILAQYHIEDI